MAKRSGAKPIVNVDDPRYVKALAHPLRIRILALLEERDASPVQLAEHLDATLGTVAYHVRTLERLGLIEMVATHQRRGATEHVYAAREHPRISDEGWSASSPMAKHVMIASVLSQAGQYATQSATAGGFDRSESHFTRTALKLDQKGWVALSRATSKWLAQVERIEEQTQRRVGRGHDETFDVGLVIMLFEAVPFFKESSNGKTPKRSAPARRRPTARSAAANSPGA